MQGRAGNHVKIDREEELNIDFSIFTFIQLYPKTFRSDRTLLNKSVGGSFRNLLSIANLNS